MFRNNFKHLFRASVAALMALSGVLSSCHKEPSPETVTLALTARESVIAKEKNSFTFLYITAAGQWTLSLEYPDGVPEWAYVNATSGEGNASVSLASRSANTDEDLRGVRAVLRSGEEEAFVVVSQRGTGSGGGSVAGAWLELPETPDGQGFLFGAHDMNGDPYISFPISGIRNWSCWWNPSEHLSMWVAYPLNNALKGSGGRTEAWGLYDPCFDVDAQPNLAYTYGGGWTRGHQIPSADRLKYNNSTKCNNSTYYPTNMTPQEYNFNGKIWGNLEGAVRNYAGKSDTLYVVTGCDLKAEPYGWSGKSTGFSVKAPGAYWKAVLSYKSSTQAGFFGTSSGGYFSGCAFYLPHDSTIALGSYLDYIKTIDQLEAILGIDLFVNLPARIGADKAAQVEAQTPGSFWK